MLVHADWQDWAWTFAFLVVYADHRSPEGIKRAWENADKAREEYVTREKAARLRFGGPRALQKDPPPLPSGKPAHGGIKRRRKR